jgi:phage baseplate assembly protein W
MAREEIVRRPDVTQRTLGKFIPDVLIPQYGVGLSYPPDISARNTWEIQYTIDKINTSMYVILTTPIGTRLHQPDFGSMIPFMVFQPLTDKTKQEIVLYTSRALQRWETRANVIRTEVLDSGEFTTNNRIGISIYYYVHGVTKEFNYIVPIALENSQGYDSNSFTVAGKSVLRA